jgi:bla regulator protein blaR1
MDGYLSSVLDHLWQSTLFAAVAGLLTLLLRKNRAAIRYGLWLAASMKFLVPFSWIVAVGSRFEWRMGPAIGSTTVAAALEQVVAPAALAGVAEMSAVRQYSSIPITFLMVTLWACGTGIVLVSWWKQWRRLSIALQRATPLHVEANHLPTNIEIMSSPDLLEPGIVGVRRPVLMLPNGITNRLTPPQLTAILTHEICHVRRRDNLAAAIHMLVEALFWFHPLVWWLETRLVDERERACDEAVLLAGNEPSVYAEGILTVCRFYTESPVVCASGVTGSNLKKRIETIMRNHSADPLIGWRKLLLATMAALAIVTPFAVGLLTSAAVSAQIPEPAVAGARPGFDVATIRERGPDGPISITAFPGGRFEAINYTIPSLILFAYKLQVFQLVGVPDWAHPVRYDILAKGEAPSSLPQLLADRFKLQMHKETRQLPMYELVLARKDGKLGPNLRLSSHHAECAAWVEARQRGESPPQPKFCPGERKVAPGRLSGTSQFLSDLARNRLPFLVGRPVEDRTGLTGWFDYELTFMPTGQGRDSLPPGVESSDAPSLLRALEEQLGLKLQPLEAPVDVLVVDHLERPTEN